MKPQGDHFSRPARARAQAAFTMVEIALCIAVVAFALVAIIGVLPTGMRVQKDNRDDTVINQEGGYWLEALKGGSRGLDELTNYVDWVEVTNSFRRRFYRYEDLRGYTNAHELLGLLSIPKYTSVTSNGVPVPNVVHAYVRALTGPAAEKPDRGHPRIYTNDLTFAYRVTVEIVPLSPVPFGQPSYTNFTLAGLAPAEALARSNLYYRAVNMASNFYDLRLTLDWPLYPGVGRNGLPRIGSKSKSFRTMVAGRLVFQRVQHPWIGLYFLEPANFVLAQ